MEDDLKTVKIEVAFKVDETPIEKLELKIESAKGKVKD